MRGLLAITLTFLVLAGSIARAKPSFFKEKNTGSDLAELDAMLYRNPSDANSSRAIHQLYGGQVRPIQPYNATCAPMDVPYQDYFRDNAIFGYFLGLFDGNLTLRQINNTWRKTYMDSIAAVAPPKRKGRMTQAGRAHLLSRC